MNIRNKVFLLFVFMFAFFAVNIEGVYADKCVYRTDTPPYTFKKNTVITVKRENLASEVTLTCSDDLVRNNFDSFLAISSGCDAEQQEEMFIVDSGTLYCPETIYLKKAGGNAWETYWNNVNYYLSATGGGDSVKLVVSTVTDGAVMYVPLENSDGSLSPCKKSEAYPSKLRELRMNLEEASSNNLTSDYYYQIEKARLEIMEKSDKNHCNRIEVLEANEELLLLLKEKFSSSSIIDGDQQDAINDEINQNLGENNDNYEEATKNNPSYAPGEVVSCSDLIDDDLKAVIQLALKLVRIAAPILLMVLSAIDFSQVVISNDQDAMKKAVSKVVKRAIATLALFFIPLIVSVAIDWIDESEYFNPDAANCSEVIE